MLQEDLGRKLPRAGSRLTQARGARVGARVASRCLGSLGAWAVGGWGGWGGGGMGGYGVWGMGYGVWGMGYGEWGMGNGEWGYGVINGWGGVGQFHGMFPRLNFNLSSLLFCFLIKVNSRIRGKC